MNKFLLMFFLTGCFPTHETMAQNWKDTLNEVLILNGKPEAGGKDARLSEFSPGQKMIIFDSVLLNQYRLRSLSDLLAEQSSVFVKSYGVNGIATLNIRGSSAAQAKIMWNGIPVSDASGIVDASLLPTVLYENIQLVYGSSASLWGSGNTGGALILTSAQPRFGWENDYEAAVGWGSFSQYQIAGKAGYGQKKWRFTTRLFGQLARNDFPYQDDRGRPLTISHASEKAFSMEQQVAWKPDKLNTLRLIFAFQKDIRQIPAAFFESYSDKIRSDVVSRSLLDWTHQKEWGKWYAKAGWFRNNMRYDEDSINFHSQNHSDQFFLEMGWERNLGKRHRLLAFTPVQFTQMRVDDGTKAQKILAGVLAYRYTGKNNKYSVAFSLRQEYSAGDFVTLPGLSASYQASEHIELRANVQRTYRLPSMNELWYRPGGNPRLKPEHGWGQSLGWNLHTSLSSDIIYEQDLAIFYRQIDDWIIWLGGAIWTPHNLSQVHSRGIEMEHKFSFDMGAGRVTAGIFGSYVRATTIASAMPGTSLGTQIPYTPEFSGRFSLSYEGFRFSLRLGQSYTGGRFINLDETSYIDSYGLAYLRVDFPFLLQDHQFFLHGGVNNLFDQRYFIVHGRPMPGRNLYFSIGWKTGKKN